MELNKKRWVSKPVGNLGIPSDLEGWRNMNHGVFLPQFVDELFYKEFSYPTPSFFGFLKFIFNYLFRPSYVKHFRPKIDDLLREAEERKYIEVNDHRAKITGLGGRFISPWYLYYPSLLWSKYSDTFVKSIIQWTVPFILIWMLSYFFNINIQSK